MVVLVVLRLVAMDLLVAVLAQRQLSPAAFVQRRLSTAAAYVLAAEVPAD